MYVLTMLYQPLSQGFKRVTILYILRYRIVIDMFEKMNEPIFRFTSEHPSEEFSDALIRSLEGKPIKFKLGAIDKEVGSIRKTRRGRDTIFADLVINFEEVLDFSTDENGKVSALNCVRVVIA